MHLIEKARVRFKSIAQENRLMDKEVRVAKGNRVAARTLTAQEAIGDPGRDDFPLQKGREVLIEATFATSRGHAFTDMPGTFSGTLKEVLALPLEDNFERAVFIATLNAAMKHLGLTEKTVHCKDKEPAECATQLVEYVRERFGDPKIAFIGLQPAMVEKLSAEYAIRAVDLDRDNIGKRKCGVLIEGPEKTDEIIEWADVILSTGSTAVNDTLQPLVGDKPIVLYGVTISGIASLFDYERYCHCGH
jgi:uncharacterized protein (DUF4213/DUF364 family)